MSKKYTEKPIPMLNPEWRSKKYFTAPDRNQLFSTRISKDALDKLDFLVELEKEDGRFKGTRADILEGLICTEYAKIYEEFNKEKE